MSSGQSPYASSPYGQEPQSDPYSQPGGTAQGDPFAPPSASSASSAPGAHQTPLQHGGPAPAGIAPTPAPGTDLGTDISAAFTFAWKSFTTNVAAVLVAGYVYLILGFGLFFALYFAGILLFGISAEAAGSGGGGTGGMIGGGALILVSMIVLGLCMLFWYSGVYRIGSMSLEGRRASIGNGFLGSGRVILTYLLVYTLIFIGTLLLYIPGLILSVLLAFALAAAARGATPGEAMKQSIDLVKNNIGSSIVAVLIIGAIAMVGTTLVITLPLGIAVSTFFTIGMFERLSGRELPDPEAAR